MLKYLTIKDIIKRKKFEFFELERLRLKSVLYNRTIPLAFRKLYDLRLSGSLKDASKIRIKNRCLITNRSQSVYRFFGLSRISVKEFVANNRINAITKSSW